MANSTDPILGPRRKRIMAGGQKGKLMGNKPTGATGKPMAKPVNGTRPMATTGGRKISKRRAR